MLFSNFSHGILTIRLAHGKASAMDLELCDALRTEFESVANRNDTRAIVITGTGSIFSAGVDLPRLLNEGGDYVPRFLKALDGLLRAAFLCPKPVVAAINGHAIAGGAILAFACDYRIMSSGRIGVPELVVGVPFPALPLEIVRFAIPQQHLQSMVYLGRTVESAEAKSMGIIDESVDVEFLTTRAGVIAGQLGSLPPQAFAMAKRQIRLPYVPSHEVDVSPMWSDPSTSERIRAYLAKTIGKR